MRDPVAKPGGTLIRVRPLAAMREGTDDVTGPSRVRTVIGLLGLAGGIALVVLGATGSTFALALGGHAAGSSSGSSAPPVVGSLV